MVEWKTIENYTDYAVSNGGKIRRTLAYNRYPAGFILTPVTTPKGYLVVDLRHRGRRRSYLVHRLVASAFIGPCPAGLQINHKDCDKTNNCVENLEYVTNVENAAHATINGLRPTIISDEDVLEIRRRVASGEKQAKVAEDYPISFQLVNQLVLGKKRKNVGGPVGKHPSATKLTMADVIEIRERADAGETQLSIAEDFPVGCSQISSIISRISWAHII